jgi:hypothetical protein
MLLDLVTAPANFGINLVTTTGTDTRFTEKDFVKLQRVIEDATGAGSNDDRSAILSVACELVQHVPTTIALTAHVRPQDF